MHHACTQRPPSSRLAWIQDTCTGILYSVDHVETEPGINKLMCRARDRDAVLTCTVQVSCIVSTMSKPSQELTSSCVARVIETPY
jgi:hypothetical protein